MLPKLEKNKNFICLVTLTRTVSAGFIYQNFWFYFPLENFLKRYFSYREKRENPKDKPIHYLQVTSDLHNTKTRNELLEYEYIIKNKYLATEDILDNLYDFLDEKNISSQTITDADILRLYDNLIIDTDKIILYLNEKLSDLIKELAEY